MDVVLRPPSRRDQAEFLRLVRLSRGLHRPWVAPPANATAYDAWLRRLRGPAHAGFLVCAGDEIAGVVNLNEIVLGMFESAYLGYYAFAPSAGRGRMRAGLALAADHAFGELGLHRLEANIQPANAASLALARRLGFRREGFSPRYLHIAGRWRDHERWALLAEEWKRGRRAAMGRGGARRAG